MNMKQLKYVLILANEGSFSRAANTLNISQPSLSQYIKKIEQQIGMDLFDRANGDVKLTDAGRIYIDIGRQILDLEHQMETQFSDIAAHKTGSLIIGTAPYRAAGMMPEIARKFQALHPGMHLIVREGTTAELEEAMAHGEYDLCLTMLPIDQRLYDAEKIMEEELVLAVPAAHAPWNAERMAGRKYPAIDARQIDGEAFVMLTDTQFMQRQLQNLCMDYDVHLKTAAVVKSLEAQIAMVKAGVGMALMPSGIERFCANREAAFYSFRQALPRREVVIMWRRDRKLSQAAEEFKGVVRRIAW
ncbi:MAG: LysR family transcriptional regulator [Clostridia bacterium]|nr:LysR family transcriptional regulator [Clostridia bacterium]